MRLLRSASSVKGRNYQKLGNLMSKKKHKKLDEICEKSYYKGGKGDEQIELNEFDNGRDEHELRRSTRTRRAPVFLDSSPPPPKRRRKVDKGSWVNGAEKVKREDGVKCETPCSSSRDLEGENNGWLSRLRARGSSASFGGKERGESSPRGKRKLFEDLDRFKEGTKIQLHDKNELFAGGKSTVVKSKRPGRIKASNVLENENQGIELGGGLEDDKLKNRDNVIKVQYEGNGSHLKIELEYRNEDSAKDGSVSSWLCEREKNEIHSVQQLEECHGHDNVEAGEQDFGVEKQAGVHSKNQCNAIKVDHVTADQSKDGHSDKLLEDETHEKWNRTNFALDVPDGKPRIKPGRHCGLCGGGTDGKPPIILVQDGAGSDNETYTGSSSPEEPNYDVWDGFGDESGWLGRLLGPINDRYGIAGIWVHQQCAVWSPEVYFAGLGCLKNVRAALCRGRVLKCSRCRRPGATIGCRVDQCPKNYHLPCARSKGCTFDHRKFLIACSDHRHLFQPHGIQYLHRLKKMKAKKMKLEMRKMTNDARRKDIEIEEKWLENCGEDEEFFKRESERLHRNLLRIAPVYIGGANSENKTQYQGWESVAGLQDVIRCMKEVVILPLLYPEFFNNLGLTPPRGVLLHGYPGTGKTQVVRALIGSCARGDKRIAYFARKGADCLGKYVGDAERQLRLLFQVAEKSQPSIIFFDEIDGLVPCRSEQQDQTHSSVVSTLLALMDGLKSRGSVIVIGATNRPDAVDPALRRPGRFDREIYFPLPSVKDREAILSLLTQKWRKPITEPLLKWVARQTVGFAGADLQALCTQAAIISLRRSFPLQEVLSAAGAKAAHGRCPPIPTFTVEERDWLEALSCAAPPCSQRYFGITVNEVASSPLDTSLIPSLLRPLTRLLVSLHLNEGVWLPLPLDKATTLIKNVIISALDRKGMQSDNWWMHVDDLLQEKDVANEIENNLSLVNILIEGPNSCSFNALEDNSDDACLKFPPSNFQHIGACSGLLQNMSHISGSKSGFQILISGNQRSGQRHLASCLLHCFVGNVDVWKVDLASISQEGHGDMVLGLTRMLMRCAGMQSCMIFMPRVDLWAVETFNQANDEYSDSPLMEPQSSEKISIAEHCEVDKEHDLCPRAKETEVAVSQTAIKNASYLWNSFVELVDSIRVHTSLMILATSEVPLSFSPHRIKQFFERETVKCSLSCPLQDKVPRFSVQLDGSYDYNMVIDSVAVKLSRDLAQHFVHLIHCRNHIHANSFKDKTCDTNKGDVDSVYPRKHTRSTTVLDSKSCPVSPAASMNDTIKGKSSLLLAISTFGHQILFYPHFGELCWVTSKLKEGPFAGIDGPWKVWPFNSCIVRPVKPAEKVDAASGSSNIKSKEKSGIVRGLVAVGLSAYRGQYTSLKEVSSEVRKVLELLVGRINDKIHAGKARNQFFHRLAQVAYLEDMVINWAHTLQSLEADAQLSESRLNACTGSLSKGIACKDGHSQGDGLKLDVLNGSINEQKMLEESREFDVKVVECTNSCSSDKSCPDAGDKIAVTLQEPSQLLVSNDFSPVILGSTPNEVNFAAPNDVNFEPSKPEASGFCAEFGVNDGSIKHSNEITERCFDIKADGPSVSGDKHDIDLSNSGKGCSQDNDLPSKDTNENSGGNDLDVNYSLKSMGLLSGSYAMCLYHCCFDCLVSLYNLLRRIINLEWGLKGNYSTIEDVHDFLASLCVNLRLALSKLSLDEFHSRGRKCKQDTPRRYIESCEMDPSQCKDSGKLSPMECSSHGRCNSGSIIENFAQHSPQGLDSRFIFRDGVLTTLDTSYDVSYHCKFEKLCLCYLVEWSLGRVNNNL